MERLNASAVEIGALRQMLNRNVAYLAALNSNLSRVVYDGDRELWLYRPLDGIPVFARRGAIVPLDAVPEPVNGGRNPSSIEVIIVVGADGAFELLEDDGTGSDLEDVKWTRMRITFNQDSGVVRIGPRTPQFSATEKRTWTLRFPALEMPKHARLLVDEVERDVIIESKDNSTILQLGKIKEGSEVAI